MSKLRQRQPRIKNDRHLRWIRTLPSIVSGRRDFIDAAHVRYGDLARGKRDVGKGERPDDKWAVPLNRAEHMEQHAGSERKFWERHGIDPLSTARALYAVSGDTEAGEAIIRMTRNPSLTET